MSVKLELYRVFKEVAEAGNITAAAQALYISQSAVSQSIKQLEGELQTRLFARNSRGVALTPDGRMLYEYVRSAIGLLETGEEKLSQSRELQMGHLTIGASSCCRIWIDSTGSIPPSTSRSFPAAATRYWVCCNPARWISPLPAPPRSPPRWRRTPASPPTPCSWRRQTIPATSAMSILWRRSPPSP